MNIFIEDLPYSILKFKIKIFPAKYNPPDTDLVCQFCSPAAAEQ